MKATFKQVYDAHALLKSITFMHSSQSIQNIYGDAMQTLYSALQEIEVEKDTSEEEQLVKKKIMDAFDEGFTEGCRYSTDFEPTQWDDAEDYYNTTNKTQKLPINLNL